MKQVSEMPTSGQFIVITEINGEIYAQTRKWESGVCLVMEPIEEEFVDDGMICFDYGTKYFIAD